MPAEVDDSRRRIEALETELEIIDRETAVGVDVDRARERRRGEAARARRRGSQELDERWEAEKALVEQILEIRAQAARRGGKVEGTASTLEAAADAAAKARRQPRAPPAAARRERRETLLAELQEAAGRARELQGEAPLILPRSTTRRWRAWSPTGPASRSAAWSRTRSRRCSSSPTRSSQRVIGQDHALEMIAKRIQTSRAGLDNPTKPIGVFMLAGTSGVGKTETALALAEALYGGEQNVITINMTEFQEAHTVSSLKGAPPGYVGYGEGGVLTEAVRRRPYSVVLLDEVEKAHPDVHEIFFQVFDKGMMEDGEGRVIDFKNTLILLTTNVGSELIMNMCADPELMPDAEGIAKALREPLLKVFPAGAARPPGGDPLLSAERRDDRRDHPAAARPHREARPREPQGAVHLRRRGGRS